MGLHRMPKLMLFAEVFCEELFSFSTVALSEARADSRLAVSDKPLAVAPYQGRDGAATFFAASADHLAHCLGGGVIPPSDPEDVKPATGSFSPQCGYL